MDGWYAIFLIAVVGMIAVERDARGDGLRDELAKCQAEARP
jgi:hypothetical protein